MTIFKDVDVIRANFYNCMREHALRWYIEIVNNDQKKLIKLEKNVEKWKRLLLKRWKKSSFTTLTIIIKKKYIMKIVYKHKKFFDFVKIIVREIKSIMMSICSQFYLIYNELKLKFRRDLIKSTKNIIMNEFFQQLDDKKNNETLKTDIAFIINLSMIVVFNSIIVFKYVRFVLEIV